MGYNSTHKTFSFKIMLRFAKLSGFSPRVNKFFNRNFMNAPKQRLNRSIFIESENTVLMVKQNQPTFVMGVQGKIFVRRKGAFVFAFKSKFDLSSNIFVMQIDHVAQFINDKDITEFFSRYDKDGNPSIRMTYEYNEKDKTYTFNYYTLSESSQNWELKSNATFGYLEFEKLKILMEDAIPRMAGWRLDEPPTVIPVTE